MKKFHNKTFIPFCEAMNVGSYSHELFLDAFIEERALVHHVSIESYKSKLQRFLIFLENIKTYNKVVLWFGNDSFCHSNIDSILQTLVLYNYKRQIVINTVIEESSELIETKIINI